MSFGWAGGDLLAATRLAWDLYHNCYLVARDAPEEFRQLVNELASLQGVLRTLRDDVNSDKSFLVRIGDARKQTLERCITGCYETLQRLNDLVVKYRKLGIGDGLQFWRKIKWVYQQTEVADLKAKVMVHTCNLSLCMSAIGNSSLARIETQLIKALERQEASDAAGELSDDTTSPLTRSRTTPAEPHEPTEANGLGLRGMGIQRQFTDLTLVDRTASPESTPSMSEEDASDLSVTGRSTAVSPRRASGPNGKSRQSASNTTDSRPFPPSYKVSEPEIGTMKPKLNDSSPIMNGEPSVKGGNAPNVLEVVAEAMKELSKIRQREQSQRPLRIVPQDPVHRPDDSLRQNFQELVNDELKVRRLNARDWLRVATWWLLKARNSMEVHEKPEMANLRGSFSRSSDSRSPSNQAYVDLLKASWILYEVILKDENLTLLLTDENRKLFYNLSDGINEDFASFRPVDIPDKNTLYRQNLNIWELLQPEEESFEDDVFSIGLDNGRWVTVEQEDAGEEGETVLFRTFVNAEIGGKRYRMKSKGAPYLLLLSTKEGESEPRVTICNQSGTLGLSREFTLEDLRPPVLSASSVSTSAQSMGLEMAGNEALPLNFGRMSVSVAFTSDIDFNRFMYIPERYFSAVKKREPRQLEKATETLLFRSSVEVFEQLKASTMKPLSPRQLSQSCDLRVLETTGREGWRTTRRLVVSSSAGERTPWCTDFFLPLSRVQLRRDGISRQILAKWSNCQHETLGKSDGNYNKIYSYYYDDSNPNIAVSLQFRTQADATDFENTILQLNLPAAFKWSTGLDSRFVYNVSDTEPEPKNYKALMVTHTRLSWKYSELYYMYRDTDYQYNHANLHVRFPQVYYTDYISTHVDKLFEPRPNQLPEFSHCVKKVGNLSLAFDNSDVAQAFMKSLTNGHDLVFSRRAHWITTKPPSRFGSQKSNKGAAEVQLWRKSSTATGTSTKGTTSTRLVSRWDDHVEDKWMTMAISPTSTSNGAHNARDSNRAVLPRAEYSRGRWIDMANLLARNPRVAADAKKTGPVTIAFETVRGEYFTSLILCLPCPPSLIPMFYGIGRIRYDRLESKE